MKSNEFPWYAGKCIPSLSSWAIRRYLGINWSWLLLKWLIIIGLINPGWLINLLVGRDSLSWRYKPFSLLKYTHQAFFLNSIILFIFRLSKENNQKLAKNKKIRHFKFIRYTMGPRKLYSVYSGTQKTVFGIQWDPENCIGYTVGPRKLYSVYSGT